METVKIGIMGGTGVYQLPGVEDLHREKVETPYGTVPVNIGVLGGKKIAFMTRHGEHHSISPGQINYRANIWALKMLGVKQMFSTACSGSLNPGYPVGSFVLLNQFIEFTKNRHSSFYENDGTEEKKIGHADVTHPYCARLGKVVLKAAQELGVSVGTGATYCCMEGPRFETAAEIRMYRSFGADLIGHTNYPEVVLAREAEICYAAIGIVSNMAAGISEGPVTATEVTDVMGKAFGTVQNLLAKSIELLPDEDCWCQHSMAEAFL